MAEPSGPAGQSLTVEAYRFAIVPEWVLDAEISDCALRLYAVLLRYGQSSGRRMPSRAELARRLHKSSVDTVDRALKELVGLGAVEIERRRDGQQNLTNRYHVRTSPPGSRTAAATRPADRIDAVTPGRTAAATPGRPDAARLTAAVRPNPEHFTQTTPPPPPPRTGGGGGGTTDGRSELLAACGIPDLDEFTDQITHLRREHAQPAVRWAGPCLHAALHVAVTVRGWPARHSRAALLAVAADPTSRSPMRVAEAGPWWDRPEPSDPVEPGGEPAIDLAELERRLDAVDGLRVHLQRQARAQLAAEGQPLTRRTVTRRAVELLDGQSETSTR